MSEEERLTDVETDIAYALGEIQNIQTELESYFDPEDGLVLLRLQQLTERLEGIEARLAEVTEFVAQPIIVGPYAFEAPEG